MLRDERKKPTMAKKQKSRTVAATIDTWEAEARKFGWGEPDIAGLRTLLHGDEKLDVGMWRIAAFSHTDMVFVGTGADGKTHSSTVTKPTGILWRRSLEPSSVFAESSSDPKPARPPERVMERVPCLCPVRVGRGIDTHVMNQHEMGCEVVEMIRLARIDAAVRKLRADGVGEQEQVGQASEPERPKSSQASKQQMRLF